MLISLKWKLNCSATVVVTYVTVLASAYIHFMDRRSSILRANLSILKLSSAV
jgi:hypothetical protein